MPFTFTKSQCIIIVLFLGDMELVIMDKQIKSLKIILVIKIISRLAEWFFFDRAVFLNLEGLMFEIQVVYMLS